MRFLRRLLAPLAASLIVGAAIWFIQLPETPSEATLRDLERLMHKMEASPIAGAKPGDIETEFNRFSAMSGGRQAVDPNWLAKHGLEIMADRLLRTVTAKETARAAKMDPTRDEYIIRVYLLRGHQLCQQGKAGEGRDWFIRALEYSRLPTNQDGMFGCLREFTVLHSVARYATAWPESERSAFMQRFHALPAPPDLRTMANHALLRAGLKELAPLPDAERRAKAVEVAIRMGHDPDWTASFLVMSSYLITSDQLDSEVAALIGRLEPLTGASIQAANKRSDEAHDVLLAEELKFLQAIAQARPGTPEELRRVLPSLKPDFLGLGKILSAADDEELLEYLRRSATEVDKSKLALLSKHPDSPDASKRAELFFLGAIQRNENPFRFLLSMRIQTRCFELAMATGGKPTADQIEAYEGPNGGRLRLDKDSSGQRAILCKQSDGRYDPEHTLLVLDPIK